VRSSWRNSGACVLALALAAIASAALSAHRLDEYLQAARIGIDPDRVRIELDLTPGIAVADRVMSVIDRDRSGTISVDEADAYAASVRAAIALELDGRALVLELVKSEFPGIESAMKGEGTVRLELAAATNGLLSGAHRLTFRNAHRPDIGVYLANALVPASPRVSVSAQRRDVDQRELTVDYVLTGTSSEWLDRWTLVNAGGLIAVVAALWWRSRSRSL
jgi:hypothetical protein